MIADPVPVSSARTHAAIRRLPLAVLALAAMCESNPAAAQEKDQPATPAASGAAVPGKKEDSDSPIWEGDITARAEVLGSIGPLRPTLDRHGISFGLSEITEVLGNTSGGLKRGAIIEGLTQMSVGIETEKAFGLEGGIFNVSGYQIHGRGLSTLNVPTLNVLSSIEARPSTRLNELWYEQTFWGGRADIKIGQQSADLEFITSEYEDLFINSSFGWPTLPAVNLPSGGAAYPLSTPGIRLRLRPTDEITTLAGVFNGSPAGLKPGDPQIRNASGTNFDVTSGAFVIAEVQYGLNRGKDSTGLPGTYKLGAWYNTKRFADAFFQNGATAQPPGILDGIPRAKRGNWSGYATFDQLVYRPLPEGDTGLGLTARVMGGPNDRNVVDLFAQGGITYKGAFGRPDDTMGVGLEWARVGARARAGDLAAALAQDQPAIVRSSETVVELTYQAEIVPWWVVQADFQYVINPGAGIADPNNPAKRLGNATVFGMRSTVAF